MSKLTSVILAGIAAIFGSFLPRISLIPAGQLAFTALIDAFPAAFFTSIILVVGKTKSNTPALKVALLTISFTIACSLFLSITQTVPSDLLTVCSRILQALNLFVLPVAIGVNFNLHSEKSIKPKSRSHGFTVVELLVVVFIILLLAGLVFGVSRLAIKEAKTSKILSNGRQVNTALLIYANENDEAFPERSIDPLVDSNLFPASLLLDPDDPFPRGFGGQQRWCRTNGAGFKNPISFELPMMENGLNKTVATLLSFEGNPGLMAIRTVGEKMPGDVGECSIQMLYFGRFFRFTLEGSIIRRNLAFDSHENGLRYCPWDLFTDNRKTCSYRLD